MGLMKELFLEKMRRGEMPDPALGLECFAQLPPSDDEDESESELPDCARESLGQINVFENQEAA